ncbi:MAG: DM13 domain-containing protein, partial [Kofleriaceae bacterium]|nr:DM13 domain-containing protein [Kofleriaceae bacterium]
MLCVSACGGDGDGNGNGVSGGEALYMEPHSDGNTFACSTCHALQEPAGDGFRRPGHPIGNAANRETYKNGQLTEFREAVNVCRTEWMGASAWAADSAEWLALEEYLGEIAGTDPADPLSFEVVAPPIATAGGDVMQGQEFFNSACVVCHGEDAAGTDRAPSLTGDLLAADLIARRVRTSGVTGSVVYDNLTGGRMPFWSADRISDSELLDVIAFVLQNEPEDNNNGGGNGNLRDCESTHPNIGQSANLGTIAHNVSGTATIIDDCTIEVTNFNYDGQGIDVRFYSGVGGNFSGGFSMSDTDLRR